MLQTGYVRLNNKEELRIVGIFYVCTYLLPFCVSSLKDFATHIDLTSWSLNRMVYLFYVDGVIKHLIK